MPPFGLELALGCKTGLVPRISTLAAPKRRRRCYTLETAGKGAHYVPGILGRERKQTAGKKEALPPSSHPSLPALACWVGGWTAAAAGGGEAGRQALAAWGNHAPSPRVCISGKMPLGPGQHKSDRKWLGCMSRSCERSLFQLFPTPSACSAVLLD